MNEVIQGKAKEYVDGCEGSFAYFKESYTDFGNQNSSRVPSRTHSPLRSSPP